MGFGKNLELGLSPAFSSGKRRNGRLSLFIPCPYLFPCPCLFLRNIIPNPKLQISNKGERRKLESKEE